MPGPWFRQSKNAWYATVGGRSVSLRIYGKANRRAAVKAWHDLLANGKPVPKRQTSVGEVIDAFLADAEPRVGKSCLITYRKFLIPFKAKHGQRKAESLTSADAESFSRKPTWSNTHRNHCLACLITCFRWAERMGMIGSNPLRFVHKPAAESRGASALVSAEDHAKLCQAADEPFKSFLRLLWLTGARPGEIAGLRMEQIDLAQGVAVLTAHKTAHLGKSRALFLAPEAVAIVQSIGKSQGLLFPDADGEAMSEQRISKTMRKLSKKAGVKAIAYGYRHSFGTRALANGIPDAIVASLMGHAGTAMLHRHYSHLTSQSQVLREALKRVG